MVESVQISSHTWPVRIHLVGIRTSVPLRDGWLLICHRYLLDHPLSLPITLYHSPITPYHPPITPPYFLAHLMYSNSTDLNVVGLTRYGHVETVDRLCRVPIVRGGRGCCGCSGCSGCCTVMLTVHSCGRLKSINIYIYKYSHFIIMIIKYKSRRGI